MKKSRKVIKLLFSMLLIPICINAQSSAWEKYFSFAKFNDGYSICQTKDSSYWVGGVWVQNLIPDNSGALLLKIDKNGNEIFHKTFSNIGATYVAPYNDDGILMLFNYGKNIDTIIAPLDTLYKLDKTGNIQWTAPVPSSGGWQLFKEVAQGKIVVHNANFIHLYDNNGQKLWTKKDSSNTLQRFSNTELVFSNINNNNQLSEIIYDYSGNIISKKLVFDFGQLSNKWLTNIIKTKDDAYIITEDSLNTIYKVKNNSIVWKRTFLPDKNDDYLFLFYNAIIDKNNNLVISAFEGFNAGDMGFTKPSILLIDENGKIKSMQRFQGELFNDLTGLVESNDDHYVACGIYQGSFSQDNYRSTLRVVKTKANEFSNAVSGKVVLDTDLDCENDSLETKLKHLTIKVESKTPDLFYSFTQSDGSYQLLTKEDSIRLKIILPSPYIEQTCTADVTFDINNSIVQKDLFLEKIIDCPYLTIDIGSLAFRPCFDAVLPINFCNQGTSTAQNANIEVQLDDNLTYQSSSINGIALGNNKYRFDLGDIPMDSCGQFSITTKVACNNSLLGKTLCNIAHIYPDSLCMPLSIGKIVTNGVCNGAQIEFNIKNESNTPMSAAKSYLVIEDDVMYKQGTFNLNPNETQPIIIQAKPGKTYRLIAEQTNPIYGNIATAALENCNPSATSSTGFINQFPQGDDSPFEDIDCRVVTASYDPNDKQAVPQGVQNQHYITKNTDIEYTIRFQNKGTDTAFLVVIKDTLSQFLDPATIQPGASSHPYRFDLSDKGIAKFVFTNIKLPHQKVNDEGSNGFVKFRIKQKRDLAINTSIKNKAAIYFDYNDPIITNETYHTIGENWLMIIPTNEIVEQPINVKIYPNPFSESTTIELNETYNDLIFNVFDMSGRLLRSEKFNGNRLDLERKGLDGGMYIYEIIAENKALQKGKIVVF